MNQPNDTRGASFEVQPGCGGAAELLRAEREGKRPHAGIARHQRQHVPSPRRTGDQANHAGPIKASHSICADVCTTGVANWLFIQQHGNRAAACGSRLHHQVDFAAGEREHDLPRALPKFDVLTFASPVALQSDSPWLASISRNLCLGGDAGVRRLAGPREPRCLGADSGQLKARIGGCQQPPDLGFDLVVLPLGHPPLHQLSLTVEKVLRRPSVVAQSAPDRELIVDRDR
jgi:hypothetical protein